MGPSAVGHMRWLVLSCVLSSSGIHPPWGQGYAQDTHAHMAGSPLYYLVSHFITCMCATKPLKIHPAAITYTLYIHDPTLCVRSGQQLGRRQDLFGYFISYTMHAQRGNDLAAESLLTAACLKAACHQTALLHLRSPQRRGPTKTVRRLRPHGRR